MAQISATIEARGFKSLDEVLRTLPDEVSGPIMEAALGASGEVIRRAAADNITSRSGRTAADLRVEVQVDAGKTEGEAAVGGTVKGKTGRAHVLRWLELGTKAHRIIAGAPGRRDARRATRALRRIGEAGAARAFNQRARFTRALKLPGGLLRASAKHPGTRPESPLTRALAEHGDQAITVLRVTLWDGIVAFVQRTRRAA